MVVLTMSWGDSKFVSKLPPHRLGEKGVRFIFALGKYENRKIGTATIKKYKGSLTKQSSGFCLRCATAKPLISVVSPHERNCRLKMELNNDRS